MILNNRRIADKLWTIVLEGVQMMTIECGMRFLGDYLRGDVYFKTKHAEHNVLHCMQFKLVEEVEKYWDDMKAIVKTYSKKRTSCGSFFF